LGRVEDADESLFVVLALVKELDVLVVLERLLGQVPVSFVHEHSCKTSSSRKASGRERVPHGRARKRASGSGFGPLLRFASQSRKAGRRRDRSSARPGTRTAARSDLSAHPSGSWAPRSGTPGAGTPPALGARLTAARAGGVTARAQDPGAVDSRE